MTVDEHRAEALRAQGRDAQAASHEASARDFAANIERYTGEVPRALLAYAVR